MLLGPKNPFLLTIRVNFDKISKLGTYMYYICGLQTHNGTDTYNTIHTGIIYLYTIRFYQNTLCPVA